MKSTEVAPIRFTRAAQNALRARMAENTPGMVRILALGGGSSGMGFSLALTAAPRENDEVFSTDGFSLCVDPDSVGLVSGMVVDFQGHGTNAAFVFLETSEP